MVLDTAGLDVTCQIGTKMLAKGGALVLVGLFGNEIRMPAFAAVANEYQFYGSLWGNYNELAEVIELASSGQIRHHVQKFKLTEINEAVKLLQEGLIVGRGIILP